MRALHLNFRNADIYYQLRREHDGLLREYAHAYAECLNAMDSLAQFGGRYKRYETRRLNSRFPPPPNSIRGFPPLLPGGG